MKTKNLMVFFLAVMSVFVACTLVSATSPLADIYNVEVDGIAVWGTGSPVAVEAGEYISVRVYMNPSVDTTDVRLKVELQGTKIDVEETVGPFVVEQNMRVSKTVNIRVPYELKDAVSEDLRMNIQVWNGDYKSEYNEVTLRVLRPIYNAGVMSIESASSVEAGEVLPVDVVLKNIGYNDLDDVYVALRIPALSLERTAYFGSLYSLEDCDDGCENEDTVKGRFLITIPYDAKSGAYTLEVVVKNDDLELSSSKKIVIQNNLPNTVITTSTLKRAAVGEKAVYELLIVNPTDKLKVYNVATENSDRIRTSADNSIVVVPAGSTKTVKITAEAIKEGSYDFDVTLLTADNQVAETQKLTLEASGKSLMAGNSAVIITIVLAVILVVLLVVLVVLLGKKSQKQEDFSESYY